MKENNVPGSSNSVVLGKDANGQPIIPVRDKLVLKTNAHTNTDGSAWGWIEGCSQNICWSDEDSCFNREKAAELVHSYNTNNQGENPERSATQLQPNQGTEPLPPTTQQDKPVLSGEVYRVVKSPGEPDKTIRDTFICLARSRNGFGETSYKPMYAEWVFGTWRVEKDWEVIEWLEPISLPAPVVELSGEDLVKVNDVVHLIFSHYSQSGGYTRTATGFIRKLLGREWEYDEELKRLQELASSQQPAPVVQDVEELDKELSFMWAEDIAVGFHSFMNKNHYGKRATKTHYQLYTQSLHHIGEGLGSRGQ